MKNTALFLAFLAVGLMSCDDDPVCLKGDGNVKEFELNIGSFKEISLSGPVDLEIKQGSTQSVIVRAEQPMFDKLEYELRNNDFEIGYKNVRCFETQYGVTVLITVPDLDAIDVSGVSQITSDGSLTLDKLDIDISGEAEVMLEGSADEFDINISGSVEVYNFDFHTSRTEIKVSGSADIEVSVENELDIDISGSATVRYMGDPTITQNVSGSLDLIKVN